MRKRVFALECAIVVGAFFIGPASFYHMAPFRVLEAARAVAEETDEHLRANFADGRIPTAAYRRIHNRIALVVKILTTIVD